MRTRRLWPWLIFAVATLAVLEGLGWVTWRALSLEHRERQARAEAQFQESVRLALWRMESELTPLIAQESARPYFHYRAFYPAARAYGRMWQPIEPGEALVPSPLLEPQGPFVLLHYEIDAAGVLRSPQVPEDAQRELASGTYLDPELLMLSRERLTRLRDVVTQPPEPALAISQASPAPTTAAEVQPLSEPAQELTQREFEARQQAAQNVYELNSRRAFNRNAAAPPAAPAKPGESALAFTDRDAEASRARASQQPASGATPRADIAAKTATFADAAVASAPAEDIDQSSFVPRWMLSSAGETLLLERSVRVGADRVTQGVWLDWPALRTRLLGLIRGMLPDADLVPMTSPSIETLRSSGLQLASLPLLLRPGATPPAGPPRFTSTHLVLGLTWLAVLSAIGAIAFVLHKSMDLSDRRGRFVSAVTHELRTPLTTFSLYTEMLDAGLVRDESQRREYVRTLHAESKRLSGIVENVLSYARLGRRPGPRSSVPPVPVDELIAKVEPALRRAAESAGMTLELGGSSSGTQVRAEPAIVERILLNLVENAGKYAASAEDRRVHLESRAAPGSRSLELSVRDHGPGVPPRDQRRVFEAFHRARRDEASATPGLGLGLALARGMAREIGGDLTLDTTCRDGARFVLTLPLESAPDENRSS